MSGALDLLPVRWRSDRFVRTDAPAWRDVVVRGDDDAVVVVVDSPRIERAVVGLGEPGRVRALLHQVAAERAGRAHGWMSLPRGSAPDEAVLSRLGLTPFSSWDWFATDVAPPEPTAPVVRLDLVDDAPAIRACLAEANPSTSADPGGPHEVAWFGVRAGAELVGVIGAGRRGGADATSWHLHGLGVHPDARRRGLGAALTAAATRAGLEAGAPWVSLGMYASNEPARRVYERLGYACEARFDSFGPPGSGHPPA